MPARRIIEIFTSQDASSRELLSRLFALPLQNCLVLIRDVADRQVASLARQLGARSYPEVAFNGTLLPRQENGEIDTTILEQALMVPA